MSFLIFIVLIGGKYSKRNFSTIWFQVVIEPLGREFSHCFPLVLNENRNSLNLITSSVAPFILNVSQITRKFAIQPFGSSSCNPLNYTNCCTIWMIFGLISKFLAVTIGLTILDLIPIKDGLAYLDIVLCGFAMFSNCVSSRFNPKTFAFYLILTLRFQRDVLLISRSLATT